MANPSIKREDVLGPILEMYMRGMSHRQIADKLSLTKQKVEHVLSSFRADYLASLSIRGLIPRYGHLSKATDEINQPFFDLMSQPDQALSNEEMLYCAFYVSTGNSLEAIKHAGLDVGLEVNGNCTKEIYDRNCLLRSEMLKRKDNIQNEIRNLQRERQEYRDATKDRILEMHLELIEQLKEEGNPKNTSNITKLLDQVNKMQGNYTTIIKTGELDADDLLDGMLAVFDEENRRDDDDDDEEVIN